VKIVTKFVVESRDKRYNAACSVL